MLSKSDHAAKDPPLTCWSRSSTSGVAALTASSPPQCLHSPPLPPPALVFFLGFCLPSSWRCSCHISHCCILLLVFIHHHGVWQISHHHCNHSTIQSECGSPHHWVSAARSIHPAGGGQLPNLFQDPFALSWIMAVIHTRPKPASFLLVYSLREQE